ASVEVSTGAAWSAYAGPFTISAEGTTTVSCRATDVAGNPGTGARSLTIDRVAPAVASTSPANGAVGVPVTASITVTLGEPVLAGAAWSELQLTNGKKVVAVATSVAGSVLTLRPIVPLDRNRRYAVSIPGSAVTDLAGNAFPGGAGGTPYRFGFTTAK
ncbi:MAG TPA: Ig-like domain-containing protein, partial [Anaeromyxobacter sp.]